MARTPKSKPEPKPAAKPAAKPRAKARSTPPLDTAPAPAAKSRGKGGRGVRGATGTRNLEGQSESQVQVSFQDRILEYKQMRVGDIRPNPRNWRTHSEEQRNVLRGVLDRVGFAGSILTYQDREGEVAIDGHLRLEELNPDDLVWVGRTDLTRAEATYLLTVFDPIGALAGSDGDKLAVLLGSIKEDNEHVTNLLSTIAADAGLSFRSDPDGPPLPPSGPSAFPTYGADHETAHKCPKCGYEWNGGAK